MREPIKTHGPLVDYLRIKYNDDFNSRALADRTNASKLLHAAYKTTLYLRNFTRIPVNQWKYYLDELEIDGNIANTVIYKVAHDLNL
jgi:hypothetical protein